MSDKTRRQIGRLAMRREGKWWNAYYAMPDTMKGALLLGSIAMTRVEANGKLKQMFMDTMRELVSDIIERPACDRHGAESTKRQRSGRA